MTTPRKRTPRKKTPAKPVEPSPAELHPQPAVQDSQPAPKQPVNFNWLSWVIVAVLAGLLVYSRFIPKDSGAEKPAVETIETVTKSILLNCAKAYSEVFSEAAAKVDAGEVKTAEELLVVLRAGAVAREREFQRFQDMLKRELPDTTIDDPKETAAKLRRIAKSWR